MAQLRCPYCGRWFTPKLRKGSRQVTCGAEACRAAHKRVLGQGWRTENPERTLGRQGKVRVWADARAYWRGWRDGNLKYVERNRVQTRERMRRLRKERREAREEPARLPREAPGKRLEGVERLERRGEPALGRQKGRREREKVRGAAASCL